MYLAKLLDSDDEWYAMFYITQHFSIPSIDPTLFFTIDQVVLQFE